MNTVKYMFLALLFCFASSFKADRFMPEPEVPSEVARKFKRDAARLALRLQMDEENLRYLPIQINNDKPEKIYKALCNIYTQTEQGKRLVKCDVHTFPDPSIDHMVIIYEKWADWAAPLQKGLMQTNSTQFNDLVRKHHLVLDRHMQWTEQYNAITLRAKEPLNMSALANEFSQIPGVQEIDLGVPKSKGNDITLRRSRDGWDFDFVLRFGSASRGESHTWSFSVTDAGKTKSTGDSGAPVPTWLKCALEEPFFLVTRN
jgi:hypothetical protein